MLDDSLSCLMSFWMKCNFSTAGKKTRGWASYAMERIQWIHKARSFCITAGGSRTKKERTGSFRQESLLPLQKLLSQLLLLELAAKVAQRFSALIQQGMKWCNNWRSGSSKKLAWKTVQLEAAQPSSAKLSLVTIALQLRFHFVLFCPGLMNHTLWFAQWYSFVI